MYLFVVIVLSGTTFTMMFFISIMVVCPVFTAYHNIVLCLFIFLLSYLCSSMYLLFWVFFWHTLYVFFFPLENRSQSLSIPFMTNIVRWNFVEKSEHFLLQMSWTMDHSNRNWIHHNNLILFQHFYNIEYSSIISITKNENKLINLTPVWLI